MVKKPSPKKRLDDKEENVSPPWEAWEQVKTHRKFYRNRETNRSFWEHPDTLKEDVKNAPIPGSGSRKRREPERKDLAEDNLMEVDLPPPPKRKTTEQSESDERVIKRARKSLRQKEHQERENLQLASRSVDPDNILPRVNWSSEIRPIKRLPYRACAIFDTCALIEYPYALTASIEKQILTVIPYTVHSELDGLKGNPKTYRIAMDVTTRLKEFLQEKNSYLLVETSTEQRIQLEKYRPDKTVKDDLILNCALRIKEEIMSIAPLLNLNERAVLLVTNDKVLSNKAMTHGMEIENVASFIEVIHGNERPPQSRNGQKKSSTSTDSQRKLPPVPEEPSNSKKMAIEKIQQQRELTVWTHSTQDMPGSARNRNSEPHHISSKSSKNELSELPQLQDKRSKNKKNAKQDREAAKQDREATICWLQGMTKSVIGRTSETSRKDTNLPNRTNTPRPAIPLEDEVIPTITKVVRPKSVYTPQLTYQSRNTVKSTQPARPRPMMPCSLSDDDDDCPIVAGDEMDCT